MQFHERNELRRRAILQSAHQASPTTLAYLAGFFDGEGSVMADLRRVYDRRHPTLNGHESPTAAIKIGNTDPKPLLIFSQIFGGKVRRERDMRGRRNRPFFSYRAYENRSRVILEKLLPYLHTKRPQAELALKLYDLKATLSPKEFSRTPLVFQLVQQIRDLNNTSHLKGLKPIRPRWSRPELSFAEARRLAAYLNSGDARLVYRKREADLKWFRVRDVTAKPLRQLRAVFGGNVVQKGDAWYYNVTFEHAQRIVARLARHLNPEKFSVLVSVSPPNTLDERRCTFAVNTCGLTGP